MKIAHKILLRKKKKKKINKFICNNVFLLRKQRMREIKKRNKIH